MCGVQTGRGISASLWTGSPSQAPPLLQMAPGSEGDIRCSSQDLQCAKRFQSLKRYFSHVPRLLPSFVAYCMKYQGM